MLLPNIISKAGNGENPTYCIRVLQNVEYERSNEVKRPMIHFSVWGDGDWVHDKNRVLYDTEPPLRLKMKCIS